MVEPLYNFYTFWDQAHDKIFSLYFLTLYYAILFFFLIFDSFFFKWFLIVFNICPFMPFNKSPLALSYFLALIVSSRILMRTFFIVLKKIIFKSCFCNILKIGIKWLNSPSFETLIENGQHTLSMDSLGADSG